MGKSCKLFFLRFIIKGEYPEYAFSYMKKKNIELKMMEEDLSLLRENTVDFNSF